MSGQLLLTFPKKLISAHYALCLKDVSHFATPLRFKGMLTVLLYS